MTYSQFLVLIYSVFHFNLCLAQTKIEFPQNLQNLIYAEQSLLSRDLNEARIMSPKANFQDEEFKPENSKVFRVSSYWIPLDQMTSFESHEISQSIKKLFYRKSPKTGEAQILLLVHPESEQFYESITKNAEPGEKFFATSTASSRTLLVWPEANPSQFFFGKLSLNKEIGGVVRTIPQGEVARSVGTNEILSTNRKALPASFSYFPETLGAIPKGFSRGGMIIREIPQDFLDSSNISIPLFSLYADRGELPPILAVMIQNSNLDPVTFVNEKILRPFLRQWLELVGVNGISMEPHAQNVLIEIGSSKIPTGRFRHRDFGGFNIDLPFFSQSGRTLPAMLPVITDLKTDYHQKFSKDSINQSILSYFENGFVYNLDKKMPEWIARGWISDYRQKLDPTVLKDKVFTNSIYQILKEEMISLSDGNISPSTAEIKTIRLNTWIERIRVAPKKDIQLWRCEGVFNP